jgi:hypothetical protein
LIWDVTDLGGDAPKAYLLFCGTIFRGRFEGIDAWRDVYEAALTFGDGHRIWQRAQDGTTTCILEWPRP